VVESRGRSSFSVATWGIFLMFLGIVFLLQTTGVLAWTLWGTLWRFWPVAIVLVGLGILLRRQSVWLVSLVSLAILGGCLGIAVWQHGPAPSSEMVSDSVPLGTVESAEARMEFTAGRLDVGYLSPGAEDLVQVDYEVRGGYPTLAMDFQQQGETGDLRLSTVNMEYWRDSGAGWQVRFTRSIPLALNVYSAASDVDMNLRLLNVTALTLHLDAGNCDVVLPASAGFTRAYVDVNVANVEISIPEGVAASIRVRGGLSLVDVDEGRFPGEDGRYQSTDYETTANRVELAIECDVGRVQVK